jgi:HD-like signal output (HDOD) protein
MKEVHPFFREGNVHDDDDFDDLFEAMWFGESDLDGLEANAARSRAAGIAEAGIRPFPTSVARVAQVVREGGDAHRVEQVLATDPAIAARVLQLANGAAFGGGAIDDLKQAVVRLGAGTIYELVVEVALQAAYSDLGGAGHEVIEHSANTARCVQMVGLVHPTPHRFLYLAALLHDVGKLLLLQSGEHKGDCHHGDTHAAEERVRLGFDHGLLGAYAARTWGLSDPIPQVIGHHHELGRAFSQGGPIADGVATVRVAQDLLWLASAEGEPDNDQIIQIAAGSAWSWLRLSTGDAIDLLDLWHQRGQIESQMDWKQRIRDARGRHKQRKVSFAV